MRLPEVLFDMADKQCGEGKLNFATTLLYMLSGLGHACLFFFVFSLFDAVSCSFQSIGQLCPHIPQPTLAICRTGCILYVVHVGQRLLVLIAALWCLRHSEILLELMGAVCWN